MSKLHQIYEDDLAELERTLPELQSALYESLPPLLKMKLRRVKQILSDVRWDYGPPSEVETIPFARDGG